MKKAKIIKVGCLLLALFALTACSKDNSQSAKSSKSSASSTVAKDSKFSIQQIEHYLGKLGYKQRTVEEDYLKGNKGDKVFMENEDSVTLFFQYAESSEDEKNPDMIIDVIKKRNSAEIDLVRVNKNLLNSHSTWLKGYAGVEKLLKNAKHGQWILEVEKGDNEPVLLTNLKQIKDELNKLN